MCGVGPTRTTYRSSWKTSNVPRNPEFFRSTSHESAMFAQPHQPVPPALSCATLTGIATRTCLRAHSTHIPMRRPKYPRSLPTRSLPTRSLPLPAAYPYATSSRRDGRGTLCSIHKALLTSAPCRPYGACQSERTMPPPAAIIPGPALQPVGRFAYSAPICVYAPPLPIPSEICRKIACICCKGESPALCRTAT